MMGHAKIAERGTGRAARTSGALGGALFCLALLTGCSSSGSNEPNGTSRSLSEIFTGSTSFAQAGKPAASTSGASTPADDFNPDDCPTVDVRQGASTFSVAAATKNPEESAALRYQGNFSQTARSCTKNGNMLVIKLGVQGRLILGPAGTAGQVEVPLRFALVQEGIQPKTVWTKFYQVPVTIGEGQPSVSFTHIDDEISVPMPDKSTLESYVLYVGFDPLSAATMQKKKAPPPKPARHKVSG
jgi:hypothetical protein